MLEAYKKFWLGYIDFNGRSSRADYWWVVFCNTLIVAVLLGLMTALGQSQFAGFTLTAFILFIAVTALPTIALQVRRLRDAGFNVAWIILKGTPLTTVVLWVFYLFPTKEND